MQKISEYLMIVGIKDVGCWDGEDEVCLTYGYDQRDFKRLEPMWFWFKPFKDHIWHFYIVRGYI